MDRGGVGARVYTPSQARACTHTHTYTRTHTCTWRLGWSSGYGDTEGSCPLPSTCLPGPLTCWGWAGVWVGRCGQGPSGIRRSQ